MLLKFQSNKNSENIQVNISNNSPCAFKLKQHKLASVHAHKWEDESNILCICQLCSFYSDMFFF